MAFTHLNPAHVATLLRLAEARPRDHALLSMSAYTALRISDLLGLQVGSVLDEHGRIRQRLVLRQKKTGGRLELALPEPLRQVLRRYLDTRLESDREEPLFLNLDRNRAAARRRGTARLTRVSAHRIFKKYLGQAMGLSPAELQGLATHALRRSLAMMIYEQFGLRAAQALLGHANIGSTGAYLDKLLADAQAEEFRQELNFSSGRKAKPKSVK